MRVVVIGSGVVGAAIAYELSRIPGLDLWVIDRQAPAQGATGAALGVLMGAISQKTKGRAWRLRHASLQRYQSLIPELEALTERSIPGNADGIVMLLPADANLDKWDALIDLRRQQGWRLERWPLSQVQERCPALNLAGAIAAIYSPQDRQVNPTALTEALLAGAQINGAQVHFHREVVGIETMGETVHLHLRSHQETQQTETQQQEILTADQVVIAAGLGSLALTQPLAAPIDVRPVLGQAVRVKMPQPLGHPSFQPVLTAQDTHLVPLGAAEYWVGATVEFPTDASEVAASAERLAELCQRAIALWPALAEGEIVQQWSGLRPRPYQRSAPVIEALPGQESILVATGHYRNGVLLAPATALWVKERIQAQIESL